MAYRWAVIIVLGLLLSANCVRLAAQELPPDLPPQLPSLPTLISPEPPPWIPVSHPNPLPSPPDSPVPDLATLRSTPDPSKSRLRRALDRGLPKCLDTVVHTCWSMPPGDDSLSAVEREFVNDMDVGKIYFNEKNYRGAELRFRDALLRKPHDEEAAFRLAESLDRQHKAEQAKEAYQSCLDLASGGQYGERSRKALERLQISSAKQK